MFYYAFKSQKIGSGLCQQLKLNAQFPVNLLNVKN